jgi:hypothetical protein
VERTHHKSSLAVSGLLSMWMQINILFERDQQSMGALRHFPQDQSNWENRHIERAGRDLAGRVPRNMAARH